jgi:hypothetical protein
VVHVLGQLGRDLGGAQDAEDLLASHAGNLKDDVV